MLIAPTQDIWNWTKFSTDLARIALVQIFQNGSNLQKNLNILNRIYKVLFNDHNGSGVDISQHGLWCRSQNIVEY